MIGGCIGQTAPETHGAGAPGTEIEITSDMAWEGVAALWQYDHEHEASLIGLARILRAVFRGKSVKFCECQELRSDFVNPVGDLGEVGDPNPVINPFPFQRGGDARDRQGLKALLTMRNQCHS